MIKIAVVDDEKEFAEMFKKKIKAFLCKYNLECHISRYMSADELTRGEKVYDLFFLDIESNQSITIGFTVEKGNKDKIPENYIIYNITN